MKIKQGQNTEHLVEVVVNAMQEVKGENIVSLDLKEVTHSVADYFVICHANSHTQVQAIARRVEEETMKTLNDRPWHKEGIQNAEWVLLDYTDIVVHVFYKEARTFYALEDLWADGEVKEYEYKV
ncbi:MAG: ribosome silencing factor [Flavobacteriales bacterium]|nr:ribosome silencing factor [Flavobacteriales bacterium]MDG1780010.1 ribosome silencing factor [Flavobacteriales bacterium]MDG2247027.1 ribosome silencing factor [Flavobacteriales bacterium]